MFPGITSYTPFDMNDFFPVSLKMPVAERTDQIFILYLRSLIIEFVMSSFRLRFHFALYKINADFVLWERGLIFWSQHKRNPPSKYTEKLLQGEKGDTKSSEQRKVKSSVQSCTNKLKLNKARSTEKQHKASLSIYRQHILLDVD